jgi:hypothetical protein
LTETVELLTREVRQTNELSATSWSVLERIAVDIQARQRQISLLESLRYTSMKMRENSISHAYVGTYGWMFDSVDEAVHLNAGFVDWLCSNDDIFWVTGKPGCGKSTLVKLIATDERTSKSLESWAEGSKVVVVSHYFWHAGHELQKSQEGLLRSLLYEILSECPDLIPLACPRRWNKPL